MIRDAAIDALEQTGHVLAASTLRLLREGAWVVLRSSRVFLEPEWVVDREILLACPDRGTAELVARRLGASVVRTVAGDQTVASAATLAGVPDADVLAARGGGQPHDPLIPEDASDEDVLALLPFVHDGLDRFEVAFVPFAGT